MYARITTFQMDPSRIDDVTAMMSDIKGKVKAISGIVNTYTMWRDDGAGVTTAIYVDEAAAEAAAEQIQAIWAGLAGALTGAPSVEIYDSVEHLNG